MQGIVEIDFQIDWTKKTHLLAFFLLMSLLYSVLLYV